MDHVVQEILKRYREFKKKLRQSIPNIDSPSPAFLFTLAFVLLSSFAAPGALAADKLIPYYGKDFYDRVLDKEHDEELIKDLRKILASRHREHDGDFDEITNCDSAEEACYGHNPVGYNSARKLVMGDLYLDGGPDNYSIKDVYCQKEFKKDDFRKGPGPLPGTAPAPSVLNVEHTWPQSRFNPSMDRNAQKSDLHHLFPADSEMNRIRGNMKFGEVDSPAFALKCSTAKMGSIKGRGGNYFEPPAAHKGNVARALFYFAVRYRISIDPEEEGFLRKWMKDDPVDESERERNDKIHVLQGNRNPFVDFPELAESIRDF